MKIEFDPNNANEVESIYEMMLKLMQHTHPDRIIKIILPNPEEVNLDDLTRKP